MSGDRRPPGKQKKQRDREKMAEMTEKGQSHKRIGLIAGVLFVLILLIVLVSVSITDITVTGNERYTDEQMVNILFPDRASRNPVFCYLRNRFQEHEKIPFVEDYKIVFQGPDRVEVIVYEKSVVGYVSYMSSYLYFDKDGIFV